MSASSLVLKNGCVLLVRHTYGAAKEKLLIPGGFCEENEMPQAAAEREVLEETRVVVQAGDLLAVRFTPQEVWCIFAAQYISGTPRSDQAENSEAVFMPLEEALESDQVVGTTREIIRAAVSGNKPVLAKSPFVNDRFDSDSWQLFI